MSGPLKLPRLSALTPIITGGPARVSAGPVGGSATGGAPPNQAASRDFSRFWDAAMTKIEQAIAQVATLSGQLSGFGTAALKDIGTSGATVPLLSTVNIWTLGQTFTAAPTAPSYNVSGTKVVGARVTGWGAASGALSRTAYATYGGQTVSAAYVQAEAQATDDALKALAQKVTAIITDMTAHGLIGP